MPVIGLGLPVYNGERYLREALESVLRQSFTDYELVIVDNASTDGTPGIAREYAARDRRIRYHRNAQNVGAANNFNLAYQLTSGRYFKWVADDDLMHPSFLERCVAALENDSSAVLVSAKARIIGPRGEPVMDYDPGLATDAPQSAVRFEAMLTEHKCFQIFGVMRRDVLRQTRLMGLHAHGDGVLLANLALLGRVVELPEVLFFPRQHPDQSMRMVGDYWSYAVHFNPRLRGKLLFPHCRMFAEYFRVVIGAPIPVGERAAALAVLLRTVKQRWRLLRGDVLYHVRRLLGAAGVPERLLRRRSAPSDGEQLQSRRRGTAS